MKKRLRSPTPPISLKTETELSDVENKVVEEDGDSDDEPILKRPRRNVVKAEANTTKPTSKQPANKSKKPMAMRPPPTAPGDDPDDKDSNSVLEISRQREASVATESSSEADEEAEENDEDEKPEVAAKTREKIQTTLKSNSKDPYPDWKPGEPVPYAALCTTFSLIEMTTKRLIIAAHCSLFLRQVLRLTPDDLLPTILLMINKLAADFAGIELGIGESLIMKAIGETTGRSLQVIKQDQKEIGDLGLVAVKSRSKQPTMYKPKALTVRGVHKGLMDIATTQGNGAQGRKVDLIKKLLSAADGHMSGKVDIAKDRGGASEAKFIVRFLEGKLRLGLAEKTVLTSLAQAMVCHEEEQKGEGRVLSTEQMAKGEAILKSVYR
jgi:DNA ligase-1